MSIIRFDSPGPFPHLSIQTFNLPEWASIKKTLRFPDSKSMLSSDLTIFFISETRNESVVSIAIKLSKSKCSLK